MRIKRYKNKNVLKYRVEINIVLASILYIDLQYIDEQMGY